MTSPAATLPPTLSPDDLIEFVAYHRPQLQAGEYVLEVGQRFSDLAPRLVGRFNVAGERFALQPGDVHATFPAPNQHGPYTHSFPHIVLERSTFPWERSPRADGVDDPLPPPWLALLVFPAEEAPAPQVVTASALVAPLTAPTLWPGLELEISQDPDERLTVIELPWSQLQPQLPTYAELGWLAHTRRIVYADPAHAPTEVGVIFSLTRPALPGAYIAHLVSLEGRYRPPPDPAPPEPDDLTLPPGPLRALLLRMDETLAALIAATPPAAQVAAEAPRAQTIECRWGAGQSLEILTPAPQPEPPFVVSAEMLNPLNQSELLLAGVGRVRLDEGSTTRRDERGRLVVQRHVALHLNPPYQPVTQHDLKNTRTTAALRGWFQATWRAGPLVLARRSKREQGAPAPEEDERGPRPDALTQRQVDAVGRALMAGPSFERWQAGQPVTGDFFTTLDDGTTLLVHYQGGSTGAGRCLIFDFTPCLALDAGLTGWLRSAQGRGCPLVELAPTEPPLALTVASAPDEIPIDASLVEELFGEGEWWARLHTRGEIQTRRILRLNTHLRDLEISLSRSPAGPPSARLRLRPHQRLAFEAPGASAETLIRLVSLYHWTFTSDPDGLDFVGTLQQLSGVRQEADGASSDAALRLESAAISDPNARAYLQAGYLPTPHTLREGDQTISWYRGPLLPRLPGGAQERVLSLPARTADELLFFDPALGMLSVAYAAAWELGRALALADKGFSLGLLHWKRARAQTLTRLQQELDRDFLPQLRPQLGSASFPAELVAFLDGLTRLEGVPFPYLVPAEALLPAESIRFFSVDPFWLECLRDGALSLGRVLPADHAHDVRHWDELPPPPRLSGFLLRSVVVSAFPQLGATGAQPLLRLARLAPDILFGLFYGEEDLAWLSLHLPPQLLHFGLKEGAQGGWTRQLRNPADGGPITFRTQEPDPPAERIQQVELAPAALAQLAATDAPPGALLAWWQGEQLLHPWAVASYSGGPQSPDQRSAAIRPALLRALGRHFREALLPTIAAHVAARDGRLWLDPDALSPLGDEGIPEAALVAIALAMASVPFVLRGATLRRAMTARLQGYGLTKAACQEAWRLSSKVVAEADLSIGPAFWRQGAAANSLNLLRLVRELADHTHPITSGPFTAADLGLQLLAAPPQVRITLD